MGGVKLMILLVLVAALALVHSQDDGPPQPFDFNYNVADEEGNTQNHQASSDGKTVKGSYGYTNREGLFRIVEYVADENGYRAMIKTNEPGTVSGGSADAPVESSAA